MVSQRAHSAFVQVVADVGEVVAFVLGLQGAADVACVGLVGGRWVAAAAAAEVESDPCVYVAQEARLAAQLLLTALQPLPGSGILAAAARIHQYKPRQAVAHTRFLQDVAVLAVTARWL